MRFATLFTAAFIGLNASPLLASTCSEHQASFHSNADIEQRAAAMRDEIADYQRLAEEGLSFRAQAIGFYKTLQQKMAAGQPLTGADLQALNEGAIAMLSQRAALMHVAEAHECWISVERPENATESAIQKAGIAMSLSAALLLYDNYLSAIAPYRNDHELRQHLNRKDPGFDLQTGTLNKIAASYASVENRQRVRRAILWYEQNGKTEDADALPGTRYLQQLIAQSPSLAMVRKISPLRDLGNSLDFFTAVTVDTLFGIKDESTYLTSLLFGNTVGLVETRRGKLDHRPEVRARVAATLRAGDILLEKTPFRLTDTFIPGHWGHAAIWVGSEEELRRLGIWDHPVTRPHQAAIHAGRGIVEALRSGVEMNNIEHFMNIDDLNVLRHETLSDEKRAEVILQTLRQVGKPYDFNFDAETTHRVFCSKLIYLAYGNLDWPTSRMLGRVTVSPDNIAARAVGDGPLNVRLLYHDGQEITEAPKAYGEQLLKPQHLALKQETPQ